MIAGWHEVRESDPMAGGVLLATIVARTCDHVVWVQSPHAEIDIFNLTGWFPSYVVRAERVGQVFSIVAEVHAHADLVVIDNLALLRPDHPQSVHIAGDVQRHWFSPKCPVIVLNQNRHPLPPGGDYWRTMLKSKQVLSNLACYPDLYSQLCPDGRWLVWERGHCIRCGYHAESDDLKVCPECGRDPWAGRWPRFGGWDYQEKENVPCNDNTLDWPFLRGNEHG